MNRLYLDRLFFAQKRRSRRCFASSRAGRLNRRWLIGGALVLIVLVLAGGLAYRQRRQLADAWRQRQVAAIPPPPGVSAPASGDSADAPAADSAEADSAESADATVSETSADATDGSDALVSDPSDFGGEATGESESADTSAGTGDSTGAAVASTPSATGGGPSAGSASNQTPPPGPDSWPDRANLDVPMIYQAPFNIWDDKHDDACEEASALMLSNYWAGRRSLTRQEMEDQILALIDYELEVFGTYKDTDAAQTVQLMRDFLGMERVAVLPVNSIDDIRRQIAAGRPVILPADGKALKNPNFRNGGPPYHMLVVKGYTEDNIIVNDPGTRRGANWLYTNEIIMESVHDWNNGDVPNGPPVMIVAW